MRAYLIHNPTAGDATPSRKDLEEALEAAGFDVTYASTKKGNWRDGVHKPGQIAAVAGGDGTVRKAALAVAGTDVPLALLPFGTANNIAKSLGIRGEVRELVEGWSDAERRPFDIGVVSDGTEATRFVEAVGGGIFAELFARGDEVQATGALVGRETDRALTLVESIVRAARPARWRAALDGEPLEGDYLAFEILNTRFVGPNVPLAVDADPSDGRLDVVTIRREDRNALLDYLDGRLERGGETAPRFEGRRARRIVVHPPQDAPLHVDDVPRQWSERLEVTLEPGAAHVLIAR